VVSVGAGRKDENGNPIAMEVKVGDTIYFGKYAGTEAGENHLIIREDEILGVVEK
jgi:chaperonin GroES